MEYEIKENAQSLKVSGTPVLPPSTAFDLSLLVHLPLSEKRFPWDRVPETYVSISLSEVRTMGRLTSALLEPERPSRLVADGTSSPHPFF